MNIAINYFGILIRNVFNFAINFDVLTKSKSFSPNRYSCNSCSVLNSNNILRNKLFYDLNYNLQLIRTN